MECECRTPVTNVGAMVNRALAQIKSLVKAMVNKPRVISINILLKLITK